MIDFTTVIACDRRHLAQLEMTFPTWAKHRPEILDRPLMIVADCHDETGYRPAEWQKRLAFVYRDMRSPVATAEWFWPPDETFREAPFCITQRERMLTGLVRAAAWVTTPWSLKLDTDAPAMRSCPWILDEWFTGNPALVSSPWSYSKPADVIQRLDAWGDQHPELSRHPPLGFRPAPGSDICRHPRIISYVCFINTEFARWASELAPERLPVPSQDTYHHYLAARTGKPIVVERMKRHGWAHVKHDRNLKRLCEEAMR